MLNILSYLGVTLQSELCLWTLLGLIRTIFDATLFKVNANLKQVWQMSMPAQLSMSMQRVLRTIISGVMLVQCFTVYVYLASYIVLLYPIFLEERPTLVLPWLLLAAIRNFLCELTNLALGLGVCVLLGPARPPCIRFVVFKVASITPAFYMWMLVFSYYNALKVASAFKRFPATLTMMPSDHDGLELAVRRRRTKSLLGEEHLRKKLVASFHGERSSLSSKPLSPPVVLKPELTAQTVSSVHAIEDIQSELRESLLNLTPLANEPGASDLGAYEDWCGSEIIVPRDSDRILEQFALMMLRIGACIDAGGTDLTKLFSTHSGDHKNINNLDCSTPLHGDADTLPLVSTKGKTASYLQKYPQIFMKKPTPDALQLQNESLLNSSQPHNVDNGENKNKRSIGQVSSDDALNIERNRKISEILDNKASLDGQVLNSKVARWKDANQTTNAPNFIDKSSLDQHVSPTEVSESTTKAYYKGKKTGTNTAHDNISKETESQPMNSKAIKSHLLDNSPKNTTSKHLDPSNINQIEDLKVPAKARHDINSPSDNVKLEYEKLKRSNSETNKKKEIGENEIEKDIKQASEETYNSHQSSYTLPTRSGESSRSAANIDTLDSIRQRIKKTLEHEYQQRHTEEQNVTEANNATYSQASNETNSSKNTPSKKNTNQDKDKNNANT